MIASDKREQSEDDVGKITTALIVDDDPSNRLVLKALLEYNGFGIIMAENGVDAIEQFVECRPDMVFMDIMMPVMDGYDATREIKRIAGNEFVPVLFLTALTHDASLVKCIEVGGDDFLTKPVNPAILQAKIKSMQRIRNIHRVFNELNTRIRYEQEIAESIFSGVVTRANVEINCFHQLLRPASTFNGDLLLTGFTPNRDLHVLLADFTGHGLAAAIGALPASEVFHAMTDKGFRLDEVLNTINKKLKFLLPTGMFMAAQYISINHDLEYVEVCNCGMPDVLFLDNNATSIIGRVISNGLPLGIDKSFNYAEVREYRTIRQGDRILLYSDGVIDACNASNEMFGNERLEACLAMPGSVGVEKIIRTLDDFCGEMPQFDDISLAEIPCIQENLPPWNMETLLGNEIEKKPIESAGKSASVEMNFVFEGPILRNADPVPMILSNIQSLFGKELPIQILFTILTELYTNALDHGVLQLNSVLKSSAEGFEHYFVEREKRLDNLSQGSVRFDIRIDEEPNGSAMTIAIEDSGEGFDFKNMLERERDELAFSGRGLDQIHQFCESVRFFDPGNRVEVVYRWED